MLEAMKITEETYDIYLEMPTENDEAHLDLEYAKGHYVVKDIRDSEVRTWRCISKENFDEKYEFYNNPEVSSHRFNTIHSK